MGTEVVASFSTLRAQLENEKSSLYKIDENIKKIVQISGRFHNDRFNPSGDYTRGGARLGGRNSYPDAGKNDDSYGKRKQETKTVFSRLSARTQDSDGEEEVVGTGAGLGGGGGGVKRARVVSAVWREVPTRAAALRAQGTDEQARTRNRRIFGSLLGTLQKFKQEEIVLQTKVDKKAQVERKIEEQARQEKERELMQRKSLFAEREHKKTRIKALEAKLARVQEFEQWQASQRCLGDHILTRSKPHLYWLPKKMNDKAAERLASSKKFHEKCMVKKSQELQEELVRIEQRCLRVRGPPAKENEPADKLAGKDAGAKGDGTGLTEDGTGLTEDGTGLTEDGTGLTEDGTGLTENETGLKEDDKSRKRDKFAMDMDEKEDSDGEDRHEEHKAEEHNTEEQKSDEAKDDKETDEGKTDTNVENDTNVEQNATGTEITMEDTAPPKADQTETIEATDETQAPASEIANGVQDETSIAETSEHS